MALKQIKNKITSTQKTGKVTKAMEAVSAVKMRKSQQRALAGKAYAEAAIRILEHLSQSREVREGLKAQQNKEGAQCFIVITSDKGLAGSLNSAVIKNAAQALAGIPKENVRIIAFGRKAVEHFTREGYTIDGEYTNISDEVSVADMQRLTKDALARFDDGTYASISVAYQNFVSTFEQNAVVREILPLDPDVLKEMVADIVPDAGKYSDESERLASPIYTVEPSPDVVFQTLIPQLVSIMVYHAMLEHKASEHSARMVAMKNATDNAKEQVKLLTLKFNRARQAVITAEVSEITGGIEAMKES